MRVIPFGIIGGGLMGREFASAAARWCHLLDAPARPEIVAVCDSNPDVLRWYTERFPSVALTTGDYRQLLDDPRVEAVYIAVPHHLHRDFYCAAIQAGKHLMGEKPFGIDRDANRAIMDCIARHPDVFVRCSSEFPFFPAMQKLCRLLEERAFGEILEASSGFLHSSDLNPEKPINWKRMARFNGEYGCLGDLGMHPCHVPFKAGWRPRNVRALLSKIVHERPDGKGGRAPCDTWDNATLFCETLDAGGNGPFPWTIKTQRIAPGETNSWYCEIRGMRLSAAFTTKDPNALRVFDAGAKQPAWQRLEVGHAMAYPGITGGIFETGFSDSILQMWAAFVQELTTGALPYPMAGCVTPAEVALSHDLFTAALRSHRDSQVVAVS